MRARAFYVVAIVLVATGLIVVETVAGAFWAGLVPARTIIAWCNAAHIPISPALAPILWLQIPPWGVAILGGALIGFKRPRSWLRNGFFISLVFVIGSYVLPRLVWGSVIRFPPPLLWLLDSISVPLMIGAAFLAQRYVKQKSSWDDDHPHCSECGYDLFGLESSNCPECGAAVENRERRPEQLR